MKNYDRKITKVGNSCGVTLPKELLREAGISSYGDELQLKVKDNKITLQKKEEIHLLEGVSPDFFVVLERNTAKHEETIKRLVDR